MNKRLFSALLLFFAAFLQSSIVVAANNGYYPPTCEERLKFLEPAEPKTIYDYELLPDRNIDKFKEEVLPISLVQKKGVEIPFVTAYKDLNWQRPAYDSAWHSSYWRWSNVPLNMAYQQHKVFSYQGGGSWWYDLSSHLALPAGTGGASPINEFAFTIKYPYVVRLIIFNFNVETIKHYKNQFVVSGEPLRKGITVIDFDTKNLPGSEKLLQLATPDGYEIDFTILYLNKD